MKVTVKRMIKNNQVEIEYGLEEDIVLEDAFAVVENAIKGESNSAGGGKKYPAKCQGSTGKDSNGKWTYCGKELTQDEISICEKEFKNSNAKFKTKNGAQKWLCSEHMNK